MGDLISIGKFSQVGCVSQRTLHVYEQKGLLKPACVNEETGYRYYTHDQYATLDGILKLKAVGLGLDEIQKVFQTNDPHYLQKILTEKLNIVRQKECEIAIAKKLIEEIGASCAALIKKPLCDHIMLEMLPSEQVMFFENEGAVDLDDPSLSCALSSSNVRDILVKLGLPASLGADRGGGMISMQSIIEGEPRYCRLYLPIDPSMGVPNSYIGVLPGGPHLTMIKNYHVNDPSDTGLLRAELEGLNQLIKYADQEGFTIAGDFFDVGIAGTPAFGYSGNEYFFKLCLPVKSLT